MSGILRAFEARLRRSVRSAVLGAAGIVFGLAGIGCLSAALWLLIAASQGALLAFALLGALYLLLALALFAAGLPGSPPGDARGMRDDRGEGEPFIRMAEGFATGMEAGRAARTGRH